MATADALGKIAHALEALSRSYSEHLADERVDLADVAYTCHLGRKAFSERRAIVCRQASDAAALSSPGLQRCNFGYRIRRPALR